MQINLFAWIVKIVSFKLAPGGEIIMVVKNNIFLVKDITDFFFFSQREGVGMEKNCGLSQELEKGWQGGGWSEQA